MVIWKMFEKELHIMGDYYLKIGENGISKYSGNNHFYKEDYIVHTKEEDYYYTDCTIYPISEDILVIYSGNPITKTLEQITENNYPIIIYGKKSKTITTIWLQEYISNTGNIIRYFSKEVNNK